jgi:hypothetical protein
VAVNLHYCPYSGKGIERSADIASQVCMMRYEIRAHSICFFESSDIDRILIKAEEADRGPAQGTKGYLARVGNLCSRLLRVWQPRVEAAEIDRERVWARVCLWQS